jgi:hypothetical protein
VVGAACGGTVPRVSSSTGAWQEQGPSGGLPEEADVATEQAEEQAPHSGHHLPAGAHLSDRRGLTATGAVAVALALGTVGGAVDVLTGPGLRTVFAVCFVLGCLLAAVFVHREDLVAAVVIPPLAYCFLAMLAGAVDKTTGGTSVLTRQALELLDALVLGAPVLLTATGLALLVAVVRGLTGLGFARGS